jgi:hypothetical protein
MSQLVKMKRQAKFKYLSDLEPLRAGRILKKRCIQLVRV